MSKMTKTLLVLGAGTDQCFIIRIAKEMGLKVIALDVDKNAAGFQIADMHAVISTRDIDAIKAYTDGLGAIGQNIDGVATMGSDIPQIVARIAEHLSTPAITIASADLATNKFKMKERFKESGVAIPRYRIIASPQELEAALADFGEPVVVKPIDQAGSKGISLVRRHYDIDELFNHAVASSDIDKVLVEEFIDGPQISTEHVMVDGKWYTPGYADRNYDDLEKYTPQIMENGGWVPSRFQAEREAVSEEVFKAAKSLDLDNCIVKGDVVLSKTGPVIIEIAARLSGGDFSESLVPISTGVNYVRAAIALALGETPALEDLSGVSKKVVANRYFFADPGRLISIDGVEEIQNYDWIEKFEIWRAEGDILPEIRSHGQRTGVFVVSGDTREQVQERIDYVYQTVTFSVDADDIG